LLPRGPVALEKWEFEEIVRDEDEDGDEDEDEDGKGAERRLVRSTRHWSWTPVRRCLR
jgi:hypothetical protein